MSVQAFLRKFENLEVKKPKEDPGSRVMKFGKHSGLTYGWIFENDIGYIKWVLQEKENRYFKSLRDYCISRIDEEFKRGVYTDNDDIYDCMEKGEELGANGMEKA